MSEITSTEMSWILILFCFVFCQLLDSFDRCAWDFIKFLAFFANKWNWRLFWDKEIPKWNENIESIRLWLSFFFSSFGSFSRNRKLFDRFKRNLFSGSGQSAINCVRCQRVKTAKRMNNFVKSKIYCFLSMFVPHTNTHTRGNRNRRKSTTFSVSLLRFEMKSFVFICRCHFERRQNLHAKREMTSTNNSARNLFILLSIFDCLSFISSA